MARAANYAPGPLRERVVHWLAFKLARVFLAIVIVVAPACFFFVDSNPQAWHFATIRDSASDSVERKASRLECFVFNCEFKTYPSRFIRGTLFDPIKEIDEGLARGAESRLEAVRFQIRLSERQAQNIQLTKEFEQERERKKTHALEREISRMPYMVTLLVTGFLLFSACFWFWCSKPKVIMPGSKDSKLAGRRFYRYAWTWMYLCIISTIFFLYTALAISEKFVLLPINKIESIAKLSLFFSPFLLYEFERRLFVERMETFVEYIESFFSHGGELAGWFAETVTEYRNSIYRWTQELISVDQNIRNRGEVSIHSMVKYLKATKGDPAKARKLNQILGDNSHSARGSNWSEINAVLSIFRNRLRKVISHSESSHSCFAVLPYHQGSEFERKLDTVLFYFDGLAFHIYNHHFDFTEVFGAMGHQLELLARSEMVTSYLIHVDEYNNRFWSEKSKPRAHAWVNLSKLLDEIRRVTPSSHSTTK